MLRCTRVWFPSKHDFFFQASFLQLLKLQLSCANQFFTYSSSWLARKYTAKTTIPFTLGITGIFQASYFFFPISMSCNAWDWKIHMVSQLNVGFFWNPYSLVTNFFVIYLLVGENPSHLSPAKAVSNSLKFLSYDRLKCIPILCGSYLRCIIDE